MEEPQSKAPEQGVSDKDLNLGYILHTADATNLGAHKLVDKLLTPKPKLMGRGGGSHHKLMPMMGATNVGGGGSTATDANSSGGLNNSAIDGRESTSSPSTSPGVDTRQTNSAGTDSDSANENKQ